jgi:hypothetical protein
MSAKFNPNLREAILKAVENQLANNNPPKTQQTFRRLISEGHSEQDAKLLIASVVAVEIFEVINRQELFNHGRFVQALDRLPEMPEA